MMITTRKAKFIKQFSGPGETQIACFPFHQLCIASGCPGECAYCFLQTQRPYATGLYELKGTIFSNLRKMVPEVRAWLLQKQPAGIIVGENQDGLAFEHLYKRQLDVTPLELLIPLFETENPNGHTLIVLSKFVETRYAEAFGPQRNVVYSWSLSLPTISLVYERAVAPLDQRLAKAAEMKRAGYRIRFRLDALAPVPDWDRELAAMIERINAIGPEMLTVGALRATNANELRTAAAKNGRNTGIFTYITTKDRSGFKDRTGEEFQAQAFSMIRERVRPDIALGLCKEDASMWHSAGIGWNGCHCLHGRDDLVTISRLERVALPSHRPDGLSLAAEVQQQ